jgi:outer membrane protein assembly factor BamB
VISFAKDTGIIRWQKTVALSADDRHLGLGGVPSTPIYQQGLLFVNTNSGVIAAIKNSGELLWNSRYPQFKAGVLNRSVRFEEIWNYGSIHLLQGYW